MSFSERNGRGLDVCAPRICGAENGTAQTNFAAFCSPVAGRISTTTAVVLSRPERPRLPRQDAAQPAVRRRPALGRGWPPRSAVHRPSTSPSEQKRKPVARLEADGADVRIENLVTGADTCWSSCARMRAVFALVDAPGSPLPADVGVIVRQLSEPAGAAADSRSGCRPRGEIEPARREPAKAERGSHPGALLVAVAEVEEVVVDVGEQLGQDVRES